MDRNIFKADERIYDGESLSARRAWIEILVSHTAIMASGGRSPQGERG